MKNTGMPFYEFEKGLFEIDEFDCASIFVIVGEQRALVIDTGVGIGDLRWVIENRITDKPYDVVITHNHGDHIGGAGFFKEVWVHEGDMDWSNSDAEPSLEFRRGYAGLIAAREDKNYNYIIEEDILAWPEEPLKKELKDGQVFDLGGRKVTFYHCKGHTEGECVAIDDLSRTLLAGDACNRNFLLKRENGKSTEDTAGEAAAALQRIYDMRDKYDKVYNSHHDFRGFGSPLGGEVLPNVVACLRSLHEGNAVYRVVPDALSQNNGSKIAAEYGNVQVSCINGDINE